MSSESATATVERLEPKKKRHKRRHRQESVPASVVKSGMKQLGCSFEDLAEALSLAPNTLIGYMRAGKCPVVVAKAINGMLAEREIKQTKAERRRAGTALVASPEEPTTVHDVGEIVGSVQVLRYGHLAVAVPLSIMTLMRAHLAAFGCVVTSEEE